MPAPVKKRTAKSYLRDIEALSRLRTAMMLDSKVDLANRTDAIRKLDALVMALGKLVDEVAERERLVAE